MVVDFTNRTLKDIEDLPIPKINKLANQAAAITGMSKAMYGLVKDDKEFNKLTEESQKLLANWMYKTSDEALDFDSTKFKNELATLSSNSSYATTSYAQSK
jgi:hypothetical protein